MSTKSKAKSPKATKKPAKKKGKAPVVDTSVENPVQAAPPTATTTPKPTQTKASKRKKEALDRIPIKEDHLKILADLGAKEQAARDKIANAYLRIRQAQKTIDEILEKLISPQEKEVYTQRNRIIEIGMSIMDFYDLPSKEGYTWQLTIEEGAWIRIKIPTE